MARKKSLGGMAAIFLEESDVVNAAKKVDAAAPQK